MLHNYILCSFPVCNIIILISASWLLTTDVSYSFNSFNQLMIFSHPILFLSVEFYDEIRVFDSVRNIRVREGRSNCELSSIKNISQVYYWL